jgi:asparagine synthase (glutamine-hydrolysing)
VPFLTPALAEFAAGLPDDYLIAPDGTGKLVLRRSLRGLVPDPILDRRDKIGFATPEESWLRTLAPWVEEVFASNSGRTSRILRLPVVRERWQETSAGTRPFEPVAWRWLNLIRWADRLDVQLD